jgi:hypothetical protein
MNDVTLHFGDLYMTMSVTDRTIELDGGPYLDRLGINLSISCRSFNAKLQWILMASEIHSLADKLVSLYNNYPAQGNIFFHSAEPGLQLKLSVGSRGQVEVAFELCDDDLKPVVLAGSTVCDQSDLINSSTNLKKLLDFTARQI